MSKLSVMNAIQLSFVNAYLNKTRVADKTLITVVKAGRQKITTEIKSAVFFHIIIA